MPFYLVQEQTANPASVSMSRAAPLNHKQPKQHVNRGTTRMSSLGNPCHSSVNFWLSLLPQHKKEQLSSLLSRVKGQRLPVRRKQARGSRLDQKLWPVDRVRHDQLWWNCGGGVTGVLERPVWQREGDELRKYKMTWGDSGWVSLSVSTWHDDTERRRTEEERAIERQGVREHVGKGNRTTSIGGEENNRMRMEWRLGWPAMFVTGVVFPKTSHHFLFCAKIHVLLRQDKTIKKHCIEALGRIKVNRDLGSYKLTNSINILKI